MVMILFWLRLRPPKEMPEMPLLVATQEMGLLAAAVKIMVVVGVAAVVLVRQQTEQLQAVEAETAVLERPLVLQEQA
jgi:hypothetical protein